MISFASKALFFKKICSKTFPFQVCADGVSPVHGSPDGVVRVVLVEQVELALQGEEGEYPTSNGGMQKWKLCWNMYTLHTRWFFFFFARFGAGNFGF